MINLNKFATKQDYDDFDKRYQNTSLINDIDSVEYNDYEKIPLTIQIIGEPSWNEEDTYQILLHGDSQWVIKARINYGEWKEYNFNDGGEETEGSVISGLTPGDIVQFESETSHSYSYDMENVFNSDTKFNVFGNVNSINAYSDTLDNYNYLWLFANSRVVSAKNLILPSMTLSESCYSSMFDRCKSLMAAPTLPATTLASGCYYHMFRSCTSLIQAPELPATTLAGNCYRDMFYGCTGLITTPKLPATTLADGCYDGMFYGCTSLITAPVLPATSLANSCYESMFYGCTGLTTAPVLPVTTLANSCYRSMFRGCTSLIQAPVLPATTLAEACYAYMFYGCTSITTAPELPATTLAVDCYYCMFNGCTSLNQITCMAKTKQTDSLYRWVENVSSAGTFVYNTEIIGRIEDVFPFNDINGTPIGWETKPYEYFSGNNTISMWVDDFPEPYNEEYMAEKYSYDGPIEGFIRETCLDVPTSRLDTGNTFTYQTTFEYDGKTYYLWHAYQDGADQYRLTETIDFNTLYDMSCESDINNRICPFYAVMNEDGDAVNYVENGNDTGHVIVRVWKENEELKMYIDDFPTFYDDDTDGPFNSFEEYIEQYMKNPSRHGGRFYEYSGEKIEYDGDEYYIWVFSENVLNRKYILTETNNLSKLQSLSVQANINNRNHPVVYLKYDLSESDYLIDQQSNDDVIVKVLDKNTDMSNKPLTFRMVSDGNQNANTTGTIYLRFDGTDTTVKRTIKYSINNSGVWNNATFGETEITGLKPGDTVQFESDVRQTYFYDDGSNDHVNYFYVEDIYFDIFGNINSLNAYSDEFLQEQFSNLFRDNDFLKSAKNLLLPSASNSCYSSMFSRCTSLTTAPVLPATTLATYCYLNMFSRCTSLTTAPELPATTLANGCYNNMFYGCTNLTQAPKLPATTLANSCYGGMFQGCSSLTTAPELPATTLASYCYHAMFDGCTSLNYIKAMFTTTPSTSYTYNWVSGVASNGTFVKNSAATWNVSGVQGVPTGWTVETASA